MFVFSAPFCSAAEAAAASCVLLASWPTACVPPPPAAACPADWPAALAFAAVASDWTLFDCETSPSSPSLPTRTGVVLFYALDCAAAESAAAPCSLLASWPIA